MHGAVVIVLSLVLLSTLAYISEMFMLFGEADSHPPEPPQEAYHEQ